MRIDGRRAVVTGGAVGIGRAIAESLAAAGAEVVIADIDASSAHWTDAHPEVRFAEVDMTNDDAVTDLMACQPQILINNAGGGAVLRPCFPEASIERWTASLNLNLRAPMLTTQLALPAMQASGGGAVVNIASTAGLGFAPHVSPEYSAAKAALIRLTATLAPLQATHSVRVNCVVPDWVATPRGLKEQAALPPSDRGPALVPLKTLTDAVLRFIQDDTLAGTAVLLDRAAPPRFLN